MIEQPILALRADGKPLRSVDERALKRERSFTIYQEELFAAVHDEAKRVAVKAVKWRFVRRPAEEAAMRRPNKWQWITIVSTSCLVGLPLLLLYISHRRIESYSVYLYSSLELVPQFDVALLLGTTKSVFGHPNRFYQYRLQAVAALFFAGKIKAILISGDNAHKSYNEPIDMKNDLLKLGIPEGVLTLDYAGFSTLDSVLRAKRIFGQNRLLVVSQPFHCKRAIYIARRHRIEAYGFAAKDVTGPAAQKTYSREYLARVKALLDVEIFNSQPRFLGAPETVNGL